MASLKDDRGYNQMFAPTKTLTIRTERRVDYMISKMNLNDTQKILEIGCGSGEISFLLAKKTDAEVLGTDICKPFIDKAQKEYLLPNLKFDVLDFIFPGNLQNKKFDCIIGNGILHHLYYTLENSLKRIFNLLNENGKIIFLEPNLLNPYCFLIFTFPYFRKLAHLEPGEMAFTKWFIEKKLKQAGFSSVSVEHKDFLLPNTPEIFIQSLIKIGNILEQIPVVNLTAQSVFISAEK